ncbi:MAG: SGNH/GDSL hydrolase family protein [Lachnospiraceae bacterium]|nr:SGNH/GDSL hydrolase family protein [Lachnospiraceae bacterium]
MDINANKKFIRNFFIRSILLIILMIALVVIFDPFYQYHKPLAGLKSVLTDKEYQCVGTLRNFDYDALIVGSSVCENYNNHWFDEGFGCTTIKAIRSYGATADLCYLLDVAYKNRDLKYVFYNIDPSSLYASTETTYESTGCPMYLYDTNYLNDISYVLNKDVLMEKIPYMLAFSFKSDYDEGDSYNWAQWKYFSAELATGMYNRRSSITPMYGETYYKNELAGNIDLLTTLVEAHPETTFKFFFSPYSMLWWDNAYRTGERDSCIYNEKIVISTLLEHNNVEIYYYQDMDEIITNLDNYMDMIHFSKDINKLVCEKLISGEDRLTKENYKDRLMNMYELSERIVKKDILEYYSK